MFDIKQKKLLLKNFIYDYLFEEYSQKKLRFCELEENLYICIDSILSTSMIKSLKSCKLDTIIAFNASSIKIDLNAFIKKDQKKIVKALDQIKLIIKQLDYFGVN